MIRNRSGFIETRDASHAHCRLQQAQSHAADLDTLAGPREPVRVDRFERNLWERVARLCRFSSPVSRRQNGHPIGSVGGITVAKKKATKKKAAKKASKKKGAKKKGAKKKGTKKKTTKKKM
jgi:hypothetical protein